MTEEVGFGAVNQPVHRAPLRFGSEVRLRGINYDTGILDGADATRRHFAPNQVLNEMHVIASELHCNAVRISGADPERLFRAGEAALDAGLEVWFSPFPTNLTAAELGDYFAECSERAESLRRHSHRDVTLVLGCELSLFCGGFLPGDDVFERLACMTRTAWQADFQRAFAQLGTTLNHCLTSVATAARSSFGGRITYASGSWEPVDWSAFDIVSVDMYRDGQNAASYRRELHGYFAHGKPVAVTEFGCCAFHGGAAMGGLGFTILDRGASPRQLDGDYLRHEDEQVDYFHDLWQTFGQEHVDAAFWFTFAGFELPHRTDARFDLDLASFGVVKMLDAGLGSNDDLEWAPKGVLHAIADTYGGLVDQGSMGVDGDHGECGQNPSASRPHIEQSPQATREE